jgi:hypothetical protein
MNELHQSAQADASNSKSNRLSEPKLFALFPAPSFQWRFVSISNNNINGFAPQGYSSCTYDEGLRVFFFITFAFESISNLKTRRYLCFHLIIYKHSGLILVHNLENLHLVPTRKGVMFINNVLTDGVACRIIFCRRKSTSQESISSQLELEDFNDDDIDLFRVCTVDPGRTHCVTSYHGTHYRQISTKEFYSFGGTIYRPQSLERKKIETGIKLIESNVSLP